MGWSFSGRYRIWQSHRHNHNFDRKSNYSLSRSEQPDPVSRTTTMDSTELVSLVPNLFGTIAIHAPNSDRPFRSLTAGMRQLNQTHPHGAAAADPKYELGF